MKIFSTLACIIGLTVYSAQADLVNSTHLDALYQKVKIADNSEMGLIHIYSEYPEYGWVKDPIEGVSAVDDIARAAVFYLRQYQVTGSASDLEKVKSLTGTILHQRAKNGYFYNFIYPDLTSNETYKTSVAEANWWTWRALWALTQTYPALQAADSELAEQVYKTIFSVIEVISNDFNFDEKLSEKEGMPVPEWLPHTAADQAAVLLMALNDAQKITAKPGTEKLMRALAAGIMTMQVNDKSTPIHGVFLSWQNLWHGYGNSQAYALMLAGQQLGDRDMVLAAFNEVDNFHPWLLQQNLLNYFTVRKENDKVVLTEQQQFAQIAYIIRPLVFANVQAWQISRDEKYLQRAVDFTLWLFKKNPADAQMYYPATGIAFDGIDSQEKVNKNSGAESTIEALLTLQLMESIPQAKALLNAKVSELSIEQ